MINVKVHSVIAPKEEGMWMSMMGFDDAVFSIDTVKQLFEDNPDETDFKFLIHCDGGSTFEGLAIYDVIRTSGKNIYTHIEGGCHSMATVLLLSAPAENRTANQNARSLIHEVSSWGCCGGSAKDYRDMADLIDQEQSSILDIYADRTTTDRGVLETIMKEEKVRTAQDLIDWGFISKIVSYNTNSYKPIKRMSTNKDKKKEQEGLLNQASALMGKIKDALSGGTPDVVNHDFKDDEDALLFSTEKEDDTLEKGDKATPDGTFTLPDGRVVVITDGVVESIEEKPADDDELENLRTENADLREQLSAQNEMQNLLKEAQSVIQNLRKDITSNYEPAGRQNSPKGGDKASTKDEVRNKLNKNK